MFRAIALIACLTATGCAGGGGSIHLPPKEVSIGQPTVLSMELSSWGAGRGKLSKRYTDLQCHYRIVGSDRYDVVPMQLVAETNKQLKVKFAIPPLTAKPGDKLEYYFDMKFDGVYNKRVEEPIPFK